MTLAQINVYYAGLADPGDEVELTALEARELARRSGQSKATFLRRWRYGAHSG